MKDWFILAALFFSQASLATPDAVNQVMDDLASQGVTTANATKGKALWNRNFRGDAPFTERSCTSCHGSDLSTQGKHIKTGKAIKPLAPSTNANSLTDVRKINKWFLRNCKWTLDRECSAQEKADLLSFIRQQ